MRSLRLERVYRMSASSQRLLADAQREAESMVDQALADDLLLITMSLAAVVRAAERNRYRSPIRRDARQLLYVSVS